MAKQYLFQYSESGEVSDVKIVDFHISRFCSPAVDLLSFIWSPVNEEVRETDDKSYVMYKFKL